ncbi:cation:proton antiporter regulatory subunit [Bacillus massiliigorillae]|uniref:cation:proton antiporter regulatory subunit n=1 Tax=Bacillus massiliigorillae TaxID=1243664 RepID=UPI00039E5165|nr:cation:proton antiporter regulatory subunit [Bacillus massiliigorillae]
MNIRESELPGIGCKFEAITEENEKLAIIIHDDGRRELYHFDSEHEESVSSIRLSDSEARKVASILGGMVYKPKALETIEMAFDGLMIEWFKVEPNAPVIQKTIGDLSIRNAYNVNIIAVLKNNMKKLFTPGSDSVIEVGDTLVISGERPEVKKFINELLGKRGDS